MHSESEESEIGNLLGGFPNNHVFLGLWRTIFTRVSFEVTVGVDDM